MSRITKNGGRVAVGVPFSKGPLVVERLAPKSGMGIWIGPTFSKSALADLFHQAGLTIKSEKIFFCRFFIMLIGIKG
jgi:hypothetical protein